MRAKVLSYLFGGCIALLVSVPIAAARVAPTSVGYDTSTCQAGVYTITATATSPDDPQAYQSVLVGAALPSAQPVAIVFQNLPQRAYTIRTSSVRVSDGLIVNAGQETVTGLGDPVIVSPPTPPPTPPSTPVPQSATITAPAAGATVSGTFPVTVAVSGSTSLRVELQDASGTALASAAIGNIATPTVTVNLAAGAVSNGAYVLAVKFCAQASCPVIGSKVSVVLNNASTPPPPTPTPTVDLAPVIAAVTNQGATTATAIQALGQALTGNFQGLTAQIAALATQLTMPAPAPCVLTSAPTRYAVNAAGKRDYGFSCRLSEDEAIRLGLTAVAKGQTIAVVKK